MKKMSSSAELQQRWSDLAIEELIRCGVTYFCVAPGSRSTPLALAVAGNSRARHQIHFDERSLGFHALGFASAGNGYVAVITTSGTAVANLLPAVVEASKKKIPLIILSADRPVELRQTGANQTIHQPGIFGSYVRWEIDMCVPTPEVDPAFVLTTVDQAVFRSRGELPGPVHLNWMFREPFAITSTAKGGRMTSSPHLRSWQQSKDPYTTYYPPKTMPAPASLDKVADLIKKAKKGLIVVGKLPGPTAARRVVRFAERLKWPVFADITSGLRLNKTSDVVIGGFDHILPHVSTSPELVLHLGGRMTSKKYYQWIKSQPVSTYISVINHPLRNDPDHRVSHRVQCCPGVLAQKLTARINQRKDGVMLRELRAKDKIVEKLIEEDLSGQRSLSEPVIARLISQHIPRTHALFLSNSLPIRNMDMFASTEGAAVSIGGNRGASGIDGIISSAAGFAVGLGKPVTVLIGDLAFMYDMNALSLLNQLEQPVTIVVLNNNGGGIFDFLPVAENSQHFETFFVAGHNLRLEDVTRQFGLGYLRPDSPAEFKALYLKAVNSGVSCVIEVVTDRGSEYHRQYKLLLKKLKNELTKSAKG